ncbi:MAG: SDR family oxidoreductase [Thermoplasmata archaeon]
MSNRNIALIGVSNFLGKSTAYILLKDGYRVSITSRNEKKLEQIRSSLEKLGEIFSVPGSITDPVSADVTMENVNSRLGGIDHVVVMIGGFVNDTITDPTGLESMIQNHIFFTTYTVRSAIKYLHNGSSIVLVANTGSIDHGDPKAYSYSIAKAGVARMTELLCSELIPRGIRVNAVAPNYIDSSFEAGRDWRSTRKLGDIKTPPEDIAVVIKWLVSQDSGWVNGAVIPVDGGYRLKK